MVLIPHTYGDHLNRASYLGQYAKGSGGTSLIVFRNSSLCEIAISATRTWLRFRFRGVIKIRLRCVNAKFLKRDGSGLILLY